jgi:FkbM family methyltransferase
MIDFENEIKSAVHKQLELELSDHEALLKDMGQIFVVGKNDQSKEAIKRFGVRGVIDDFSNGIGSYEGIPLVLAKSIPENSIVINCVTSICPTTVKRNLEQLPVRLLPLHLLISDQQGRKLSLPRFVRDQRTEILENFDEYCKMFETLADTESRRVLIDVLRYRLTANSDYLANSGVRTKEQYFEAFMNFDNEIFVDAGGYDGDTTEEFTKRVPNYRHVFLYEPSPANMSAAKRRLRCKRDITYKSVGVSDENGFLEFNVDEGSSSGVKAGSGQKIPVVRLDDDLKNETISFIKMDLEGWELNALKGAEDLLRAQKPKLAIAGYHSSGDLKM